MAYFNILGPGEISVCALACLGIYQDHVTYFSGIYFKIDHHK